MTLQLIVFFFFAVVAVAFALMVVLHKHPVVNAISLVVCFFALAVMYVLLDAAFMAALQVIVYAGAIMVLFVFVIMLLNLQHEEEPTSRPIQRFLGYFAGAAFGLTLVYYIVKAKLVGMGPGTPFPSDVHSIGMRMFEAYIFPFELASILLLAAIVGALLLTQREKRGVGEGGAQ